MEKYSILLIITIFLALSGCRPNLVVQEATIDFSAQTVSTTIKNIGNGNAGQHFTYIEINEVGAVNRPQSQFSVIVSGITPGSSWSSGPVPFSSFSSPRGLDLSTLTAANLVVRADAKNDVKESNEDDNIYDVNH